MQPNPTQSPETAMTHAHDATPEPEAMTGAPTSPEAVAPEAATPDPFAVLEALNAENMALKDKNLRTLAEMENLRRRTEREISDGRAYAVTKFAGDMLNVADNVARALAAIPAEARAGADGAFKALIEGIEVTERDLHAALARHNVRQLEPEGKKFDPNFHQAIYEIPDESVPSGTVKQVMQTGWSIGERVLRPAMVGVSKGGPKVASVAAEAERS